MRYVWRHYRYGRGFSDLSLEINQVDTVAGALQVFTKVEELDGDK